MLSLLLQQTQSLVRCCCPQQCCSVARHKLLWVARTLLTHIIPVRCMAMLELLLMLRTLLLLHPLLLPCCACQQFFCQPRISW